MNSSTDSSPNRRKVEFHLDFEHTETLTNCHDADNLSTQKEPSISLIKQQIHDIKARYRPRLPLPRSKRQDLLVRSTAATSVMGRVSLVNQSEEDKVGLVFSPFKEKIKPTPPKKVDCSIDWERRAAKVNRDQEENAIMKRTLEVRRTSLVEGLKQALDGTRLQSFRSTSKNGSRRGKPLHSSKLCLPQNVFLLRLQRLKQVYSVLAELMMSIAKGKKSTMEASEKYVSSISGLNLEFIDDFIEESEERLQKAIRCSRIMESTSVIYLVLELLKPGEEFQDQGSNLGNLIGHSASNMILLARMFILAFKDRAFHQSEFEECIRKYEELEFKRSIETIEEAVLRMGHNNQIIQILNGKLGRINLHFSTVLNQFMRNLGRNNHSASQFTHFLFEFVAFHINTHALTNILPFLDCAPNPYLSDTLKPYTLVVEPYGVLFLMKNGKVRVRPFVEQLLQYLSHQFSLVFWTWMMPSEIDEMFHCLPSVPVDKVLYRYHCKEEKGVYLKNLFRVGRSLDKVLLIDYSSQIFRMTPNNGMECGWNGSAQDRKLLNVLQIVRCMHQDYLSVEETINIYNEEINSLSAVKFRSRRTGKKHRGN